MNFIQVVTANLCGDSLHGPDSWIFRGKVFKVEGAETTSQEEIKLRLKHEVFRRTKEIEQIRLEVEAYENLPNLPSARRKRIPEPIRMFV